MPYSIKRSGITLKNIPDDVSPDDPRIQKALEIFLAEKAQKSQGANEHSLIGQGYNKNRPIGEDDSIIGQVANNNSVIPEDSYLSAIGRGLAPVASGAAIGAGFAGVPGAIAGAGIASASQAIADPLVLGINSILGTKLETPTEAFQALLTAAGVPESKTITSKILQAAASGAGDALGFAGLGKSLLKAGSTVGKSSVAERLGKQLSSDVGENVAQGAGAGAAMEVARENGDDGLLGQIASGLAGAYAGKAVFRTVPKAKYLAQSIKESPLPPKEQEIVQQGKNHNIRVLANDLVPPETHLGKLARSYSEKFGSAGLRAEQQKERTKAVYNFLQEYGVDAEDLAQTSEHAYKAASDFIKNNQAQIAKFSKTRSGIIKQLANSGIKINPVKSKEVYDHIETSILQNLETNAPAYHQVLNAIEGLHLKDGLTPVAFDNLRSSLASTLSDPALIGIRPILENYTRKLYGAINEDIKSSLKQYDPSGKTLESFLNVNKEITKFNNDMDQKAWRAVLGTKAHLEEEAQQKAVTRMLGQDPVAIKQIYRGLNEEGRKNAKIGIMHNVAQLALENEALSPERFVLAIEKKMKDPINIFFQGKDKAEIVGLLKILKETHRASQAGLFLNTGMQNAVPAAIAAAKSSSASAWWTPFVMIGYGTFAHLYESRIFRDYLVRAAHTSPKSKSWKPMMKHMAMILSEARTNSEQDETNK